MADLIERLAQEARFLNFFGAVSLLEAYFERKTVADPIAAGAIQFEPDTSLAFPPSDIVSIAERNERIVMKLSFMGLVGVSSPLPVYFSEYIVQHEAEAEALLDFLTIFNNRAYALFYRAWKKYRLARAIEQYRRSPLVRCIAALAGMTEYPGNSEQEMRRLAYAGLLAGAPRSAAGLSALLSDFFGGVRVDVQEFMPRWARLPDPMRLGEHENARLGATAVLGTTILDRSGKFRVVIGPVGRRFFEEFTERGNNFAAARSLVGGFLSDPLEYDFELLLKAEDTVPVALGSDSARLGETATLGESPDGDREIKRTLMTEVSA